MKPTTHSNSPAVLLFSAVVLILLIILMRIWTTAPSHPVLGAIAFLTFLALAWLLIGMSLK